MHTTVETVEPEAVAARREADRFVLDVRKERDYARNHIAGSENVPVYEQLLDGDVSGLDPVLDDLPEDEEIVTVCKAGVTSALAAEYLQEQGYDAKSMAGGMRAWPAD